MLKKSLRKILPINTYLNLIEIKNFFIPSKTYRQYKHELEERIAFYKNFVSEGDIIFDIGANYGGRVETFLKLKAKVVAVEPNNNCVRYLKARFKNKITIVNKGAGAEPGILDYYVSDNAALSSFSTDWLELVKKDRFAKNKWEHVEKKEITTIDMLIKEYGKPNFIKIDVEGFELNVLKGLSVKIDALSFEYAVPERLPVIKECIGRLENLGKVVFNYSQGETMRLALNDWISPNEMKALIQTKSFIDTYAGDIYARFS